MGRAHLENESSGERASEQGTRLQGAKTGPWRTVGNHGTHRNRGRHRRSPLRAGSAVRGSCVRPSNLRLLGGGRSRFEGPSTRLAPNWLEVVGNRVLHWFGRPFGQRQPVRPAAQDRVESVRPSAEGRRQPLRSGADSPAAKLSLIHI